MVETAASDQEIAEQEKRSAALSSVLAAVLLTVFKLAVGALTGSLGILAEAAHSGLDLIAALVTFFAVRISDRPPDEEHQYGYGKVENLSALVETLLLLITCLWIIYEAVQRLFYRSVEIEASLWGFGVMVVSIVVDVNRSRMLYRAARKHRSQALEADALHFSTDIWSSSVVIVGLALVYLSERLGPQWGWLAKGDAVAALVVALIVVYVSLQLGRRAVSVLLDAAPPGLADRIEKEARQVSGVQSVGPVRVRQAGAGVFVDLTIEVERSASLHDAHQVAAAVDERITQLLHRGDVVVRIEPVRGSGEGLTQTVSALAARYGLRTHYVHAHEVRGQYMVDLHVEVPSGMTLAQAHDRVSKMEQAVRSELPQVRDIHSHIEPITAPAAEVAPVGEDESEKVREQIRAIVAEIPGLGGCTKLHIRPMPGGYDVVIHCLADADLPVEQAHRLADELEQRLKKLNPAVSHVLVHIEPAGQA